MASMTLPLRVSYTVVVVASKRDAERLAATLPGPFTVLDARRPWYSRLAWWRKASVAPATVTHSPSSLIEVMDSGKAG